METIKVQWQANAGLWLCAPLDKNQWQPLADWADAVADLTQVRLVLSPVNYATHWVSLPGVASRHINRALPFALEEALVDDVSQYLIVAAGQSDKKVRAYALSSDLVERLLEECSLHHLTVRELIPLTQCMNTGNSLLRSEQAGSNGWLINLPGRFEGWVPDTAMSAVLDSLLDEEQEPLADLIIGAPMLDQAQLLKSTIETGYSGRIGAIECRVSDGLADMHSRLGGKLTNLLTGQFQVREVTEAKPAAWWRPLAAMAAVWLVLLTAWLFIGQHTTRKQADQVYTETLSLYKSLFPGERIRMLDRQIREKVSGQGTVQGDGFLSPVGTLAKVYATQNLQKQVQVMSLRYNDKLQEITLEVQASSLNELQTLKAALEKEGLNAEVASATNDKDGVKGRIRIGGAA
ncbi:type II secretion system protein GspL [Thalassolituus sp. LLYu03]|uniref:type II secretion system protein GspL n=1 Tax=Thalassolituus sp. LLYu03 TaxID=3421656 RepID=UPI003D2BB691